MKVRRRFSTTSARGPRKSRKRVKPELPLWDKRNLILASGIVTTSAVVGYLYAALILFPAPFIVRVSRVPGVLGQDINRASETLTDAGFVARRSESVNHPTAPTGTVVWQDPPPEVAFPQGTPVQLSVSIGPASVEVPDVSGYDLELATRIIQGAGLVVGSVQRVPTPAPQGMVENTRPTDGTFLDPGSEITILVSEGAPTISVPNLLGLTPDSAGLVLMEADLQLGTSFLRTSGQDDPGLIIEQNPAPGTLSVAGTPIDIWISRQRRN